MKRAHYVTPHYAVLSESMLLPSLSYVQTFSPTLCSHMSWIILLLSQKLSFNIHTEQQGE